MKINEANIEINREGGKLRSVSIDMPIWDKTGMDNFISVNIPLLGIKTFAKDESDAEAAVREAVTLFCINSEKFGKRLEAELRLLGWDFVSQSTNATVMSFSVPKSSSVIDEIMQTGEHFVEKLELAC